MTGGSGPDYFCGGSPGDTAAGGTGTDVFAADSGNDTLKGGDVHVQLGVNPSTGEFIGLFQDQIVGLEEGMGGLGVPLAALNESINGVAVPLVGIQQRLLRRFEAAAALASRQQNRGRDGHC